MIMKIRMDQLIQAIAVALETVERNLLGASNNHGKRIAVLCALMCKKLGLGTDDIKAVTTCALFHDNALTEYILSERESGEIKEINLKLHCIYGQRNIDTLLFSSDVKGLVHYHHEQADGGGPFGKKEGEFPFGAELIAIADMVDVKYHLQNVTVDKLPSICDEIAGQRGKCYTKTATDTLLAILDNDTLLSLRDEKIEETAADIIPAWEVDIEDEALIHIATLAAKIIDYASVFTRKHSVQIANMIWYLGKYYDFGANLRAKAYLAAALHDLGKLDIPTEILEKPGKLTDDEFTTIKSHASGTNELLKGITGFEDVCNWASNHHEKLDGTGYGTGKDKNELDFVSRLIACTDIYQAIREERPYHPARSHEEAMPILRDMAGKGLIDEKIVKDFETVLAGYSDNQVKPQ